MTMMVTATATMIMMICFLIPCRGVALFRPKKLNSKFEDSLVKYGEEKITSSKLKKFIQDNV